MFFGLQCVHGCAEEHMRPALLFSHKGTVYPHSDLDVLIVEPLYPTKLVFCQPDRKVQERVYDEIHYQIRKIL